MRAVKTHQPEAEHENRSRHTEQETIETTEHEPNHAALGNHQNPVRVFGANSSSPKVICFIKVGFAKDVACDSL